MLVAASSMLTLGACRSAPPASLAPSPVVQPAGDAATGAVKRDSIERATRFYANRPYGSEAQFNPVSIVLNEGFDQLRTSPGRNIIGRPYGTAAETILRTITHPERVLRHYGYRAWLRNEVFPLSLKGSGGGQWYPNYQLHLWGSGMTYIRLAEWYEQHGVESHPRLAAGMTAMAFHYLNEMIENNGLKIDNEDALTDLLLFDVGSIVLWNQEWMQRLFSGRVEMTDWPGQLSIGEPGTTMENQYSMVMARFPVPLTSRWKVMTTAGNAFLVGLSRRVADSAWVSVSGGFDPADNPIIDPATGRKTATLLPNVGLFYDRNSSLLISFISKGGSNIGSTLNVYPGALIPAKWMPGFWVQGVRGGGVRFGLVSRLGLGLSGHTR